MRAAHSSLAVFAIAVATGGAVRAGSPALVVEVDTGRVLHAERATDPWFPASITKLMTTYVALDMVRTNRASMDQLLTVTEIGRGAAALEDGLQARDADPPRQRPENPDGQVGERRCRDRRRKPRRLDRGLRGHDERHRPAGRHAGKLLRQSTRSAGRAAADLGAGHGDPRACAPARVPGAGRPLRYRRHPVRTARHAQPQRAHRTLSRRRRHEDGLHLRFRLQRRCEREPGRPPADHGRARHRRRPTSGR